jgi:uncharacterized protein
MIDTPAAHIGFLMLDLHIPGADSLKAKRRVLSSFKERTRAKFNVSVAELGALDKWQRSICGVVMIANEKRFLESTVSTMLSFVESFDDIQVVESQIEFL